MLCDISDVYSVLRDTIHVFVGCKLYLDPRSLLSGCTTKEVRDRFKKLALKWHPDKNIDNPDEAQKVNLSLQVISFMSFILLFVKPLQKFQAISAAYTKLVSSEEDDDIPTVSASTQHL